MEKDKPIRAVAEWAKIDMAQLRKRVEQLKENAFEESGVICAGAVREGMNRVLLVVEEIKEKIE